jgi:hypothetical protein
LSCERRNECATLFLAIVYRHIESIYYDEQQKYISIEQEFRNSALSFGGMPFGFSGNTCADHNVGEAAITSI